MVAAPPLSHWPGLIEAYRSYLPSLVRREELVEGNSKLQASGSVAEVAGFGLAGAVVQALTAPVTILVDSVSFVVSAASLLLIRKAEPAPREGRSSQAAGRRSSGREGGVTPHPPEELSAYYAALAEAGFSSTWIRTDYRFASPDEAEELTRFFFGAELAERVAAERLVVLPECTGIWWASV